MASKWVKTNFSWISDQSKQVVGNVENYSNTQYEEKFPRGREKIEKKNSFFDIKPLIKSGNRDLSVSKIPKQ